MPREESHTISERPGALAFPAHPPNISDPLGHSESGERYRWEIEDAIFAVEELWRVVESIVAGEFAR